MVLRVVIHAPVDFIPVVADQVEMRLKSKNLKPIIQMSSVSVVKLELPMDVPDQELGVFLTNLFIDIEQITNVTRIDDATINP